MSAQGKERGETRERDETRDETQVEHLLSWGWSILANAGGGDWTKETPEWQEAVVKWRDEYHDWLTRYLEYRRTGAVAPDPKMFTELELFCAGALSSMPPFDQRHPSFALPFARCVLEASARWEPHDGGGVSVD